MVKIILIIAVAVVLWKYIDYLLRKNGLVCQHDWKTFEKSNVYTGNKLPTYHEYYLKCTKCGDVTKRRL